MFKKIAGSVLGLSLVAMVGLGIDSHQETVKAEEKVKLGNEIEVLMDDLFVDDILESNVGNGEAYQYKITEVYGNEIKGLPINKESYTNKGIFLYADEVDFEVSVGDEIEVVWGEYEDEFKSITRVTDKESDTKGHAYKKEDITGKWNYEITAIKEDGEIIGKPLDRVSEANTGIFLYQEEISFELKAGDKIEVTFGEYADEFKSIKKVGKDGTYIDVNTFE